MARKTFAFTVILYTDFAREIVSELLWHSNMKNTQENYGEVVQKSTSEEIEKLSSKIG